VVISELSGAGFVLVVSMLEFALTALAFAVSFVLEQPAANATRKNIVAMQRLLVTVLTSSLSEKLLSTFGKQRATVTIDHDQLFPEETGLRPGLRTGPVTLHSATLSYKTVRAKTHAPLILDRGF
jgi:hypothetical protein